jgi:type II secretory pathway component GspD/PulD (secretin)
MMRREERSALSSMRIALMLGGYSIAWASLLWAGGVVVGAVKCKAAPQHELVTLAFRDAPVADVVASIAHVTGRVLVFDDRLDGRITLTSVKPVLPMDAYEKFRRVLRRRGFSIYEGIDDLSVVVPTTDYAAGLIGAPPTAWVRDQINRKPGGTSIDVDL